MQELQLEKEKVNEVRVDESFAKKVTHSNSSSKEDHYGLEKSQQLKAVKTCKRLRFFFSDYRSLYVLHQIH